MAFKMKGPSTHKGTLRHKLETDNHQEQIRLNRSMDQTSLPDGRAGSSALQLKDSSPAKGVFGIKINAPEKSDEMKAFEQKQRIEKTKKELAKKPQTKAQKKKLAKDIKSDKNFIKKAEKRASKGKTTKPDKPGTVVSRAAKKVGKKIKQGVRQKVADVKQGIRDKKILKQKARKAADTPEKRLALRKERSTKIADQLEYIFLDGKRPDRLEAKRRRKAEKKSKDTEIKKEKPFQTDTIPEPYDTSKLWDPKNPDTNMKDFGLNTQERHDEYNRRNWKHDKTSKVKKK